MSEPRCCDCTVPLNGSAVLVPKAEPRGLRCLRCALFICFNRGKVKK